LINVFFSHQIFHHHHIFRFGTRRIKANTVYQEYISDRNHLHMNSTKWQTLTEFCKYLGRAGICEVEETEKGWYISYIDRDPEVIARQVIFFFLFIFFFFFSMNK